MRLDARPVSALALMLATLAACSPQTPEAPAATAAAASEDRPAIGADAGTPLPKATAEVLAALSPAEQAAVRALVRDTLVSNPDILLEAQQAFEAQAQRRSNERVAAGFEALKSEHAQLSFGPANAPITVIEFFDYKCTFCHAATPWLINLMNTRSDVRVIFKELPILSENSTGAARAALAAHRQGKYLEFHNALMTARGDLNLQQVMEIAASVGLDVARLQRDMADPAVEATLNGMREQATSIGVNGTPGFVINGNLVSGFDQNALDAALAGAGVDAPASRAPG